MTAISIIGSGTVAAQGARPDNSWPGQERCRQLEHRRECRCPLNRILNRRPEAHIMKQATTRVIVLHGAHGGPDTNWFPWLDSVMTAEGFEVVRPRFPTPQGQSLSAWLSTFDETLADLPAAPTVLVGHSLGAAFALRLVERAAEPLAGLFLAAPFIGALGLPDYDPINHSFFDTSFDWPGINARAGSGRGCWAGDNDPYVPLARSQEVADRLQTRLNIVPASGHLNAESGFVTFPAIRDAIRAARS